jgi:Rrf2 family iron-sulfur cluster assembly transcriptional regulator
MKPEQGAGRAARGPGGGYILSRSAEDIRIADIILAVDEPIQATPSRPGSSRGCTASGSRCLTHDLWEELGRQIQIFLSTVSLADVSNRRVLGASQPMAAWTAEATPAARGAPAAMLPLGAE